MKPISRYQGGHLFSLYRQMTDLEIEIAKKLGGMTNDDFKKYKLFVDRTIDLTNFAFDRNCILYVDAEQSFI